MLFRLDGLTIIGPYGIRICIESGDPAQAKMVAETLSQHWFCDAKVVDDSDPELPQPNPQENVRSGDFPR